MSLLDSFKLKSYNLEPIYDLWVPPPPTFTGSPTQSVDDWLAQVKVGCTEYNIPREYWHKAAQHYMSPKAKARLDELKMVMSKVHGGKGNYRWNWEKFKTAMRNMGWNIDDKETETVKVQMRSGGRWWLSRKNSKDGEVIVEEPVPITVPDTPPKVNDSKFWLHRRPSMPLVDEPESITSTATTRPVPTSMKSDSIFKVFRSGSTNDVRPTPQKAKSESTVATMTTAGAVSAPPVPTTTITQAPIWLINACNALDFLNNEHPKVMSTISAILITAGTLPTIPAVAAGAGGAVLASGAAHAVGAIAVGLGSWLRVSQEATAKREAEAHGQAAITNGK